MPYALGAKSLANLTDVHPDLIRVVKRAITTTTQDFGVHEGLRTLATQKEYVKRGVSWTLASKHLLQPDGYGHAVDLVPYVAGQLRWEWPPIYKIASAMRGAAILEGVTLRWGGVWDRTINELPGDAKGIEMAVEAYVARRKAAGKKARIDGPHYELVGG